MARENAKVTQQMQPWRRHCGDKPGQKVVRFEHEGTRAVAPDFFQFELESSVGAAGETVLGDRGTGDVATEPLELFSVSAIDPLPGVHVDAAHLGDGHLGAVGGCRWSDLWHDEPQGGLSGALAGHRDSRSGGSVASRKARAVHRQGVGVVDLHLGAEAAAALAKDVAPAPRGLLPRPFRRGLP